MTREIKHLAQDIFTLKIVEISQFEFEYWQKNLIPFGWTIIC